ncbi:MAG: citrate lyase holo-[acyl-carrier protein] synthase [Bacillota bacterium]|nr:citrate lyase holo-[acyl-carrier protein] synthase [Bacillota bacterium]
MEDFVLAILDAREKRYEKQRQLVEKFQKPIISFMINIPGREKYSEKLLAFHKQGIKKIEKLLADKIIYAEFNKELTGSYYLAAVDLQALDLKKLMIDLENSPAGRLYDLDVFDKNMKQITRSLLGEKPRSCLLCKEPARICIRKQSHSFEDLAKEAHKLIDESLRN